VAVSTIDSTGHYSRPRALSILIGEVQNLRRVFWKGWDLSCKCTLNIFPLQLKRVHVAFL
jgi:hypothetical protein